MTRAIENWVNGAFTAASSGRSGKVYNPAVGEVTGEVGFSSTADVTAAIAAAQAAFPKWADTSPLKRARVMFKFKELLERDHRKLAEALTAEHGKTIPDAMGEVVRGLEVVEFACGIPHALKGDFTEQVGGGIDSWSWRQPLGVVGNITPFNFPVMIPLWMSAMAIACGNTVICKPSEKDPTTPNMLAELYKEAGLPDGVFNVVHGDKEAVDAILHDERVQAVHFVGSTPIAEYIWKTGTDHGKRVAAFGGAKNHMIIMPDADLDQAADALIGAGYGAAGERCMAISVAVPVGKETADGLIERMVPKIETLKVSVGTDEDADYGPLISKEHEQKVRALVQKGVDEGADLLVDGRNFHLQGYENGNFLGPCLFDNVTTDMEIWKQEIFGPVLSMVRADSFEDAVDVIHKHEYANGTAIFTREGDAAREFARRIQVGMVGINVPIPVPMAFHSFGGWKSSAFGDHNMFGMEAVRFYSKVKTVTSRWPTGVREGASFVMPTN